MKAFDAEKKLIVDTAQQLVHKGYLMATGGNLSLRHSRAGCICHHPIQLRLYEDDTR